MRSQMIKTESCCDGGGFNQDVVFFHEPFGTCEVDFTRSAPKNGLYIFSRPSAVSCVMTPIMIITRFAIQSHQVCSVVSCDAYRPLVVLRRKR